MNISYSGQLHCEAQHEPSNSVIQTDAPKDNAGRGEAFSPTDLVAAALATCAVTTMAIKADKENIPFEGASARVEKIMSAEAPRRIAQINLRIDMMQEYPADQKARLEEIGSTCPVALSLAEGTKVVVEFVYPQLQMGA